MLQVYWRTTSPLSGVTSCVLDVTCVPEMGRSDFVSAAREITTEMCGGRYHPVRGTLEQDLP
jgi:hypothetical protein